MKPILAFLVMTACCASAQTGDTARTATAGPETAQALMNARKHAEAEQLDTLQNCYNLALCLQAEKKNAEALIYAQRAYAGRLKVLGQDHPNTLKAQKLAASLAAPATKSWVFVSALRPVLG